MIDLIFSLFWLGIFRVALSAGTKNRVLSAHPIFAPGICYSFFCDALCDKYPCYHRTAGL